MIQELHIRDLGVIREARLGFKPGFNVITGETGAGKTMVLTALGLLLGQRADAGSVRSGQNQALVEGRIQVTDGALVAKIEDMGGSLDDGELILNRIVSNEGKSRAMLGGVAVPVAGIGEIANQLVVVHGQADQLRLKSAVAQREALDNYAGHITLLERYREAFNAWQITKKQIEQLEASSVNRAAEVESLKFAVAEISKVNPISGEDLELADLANRLSNLESLRFAASSAHEMISSDADNADALGLVGQAKKILEHESDSKLLELSALLSEVTVQLRDISAELASYLSALDDDSELSLDQVQSRRAELNGLLRKYGASLDDVLSFQAEASSKLQTLDVSDEQVSKLKAQEQAQCAAVELLAEELTASRKQAANKLAAEVTAELKGLAMADSTLVVEVTPADVLGATGADTVAILLSSYSGAEPRPIGKGASGGEISRIMLAIEVVLAKDRQATTFIFDEVDAGVGGAAAIEVGRRLARLAKQAQVVVVTHLAQVAAFADHQLRVLKNSSDNIAETDVVVLDPAERLEELARMLSGLSESASAREHAAELMSLAKSGSAG
ncbi:MAG: DNA repair protein RecN [Micrococcales bacterium]